MKKLVLKIALIPFLLPITFMLMACVVFMWVVLVLMGAITVQYGYSKFSSDCKTAVTAIQSIWLAFWIFVLT